MLLVLVFAYPALFEFLSLVLPQNNIYYNDGLFLVLKTNFRALSNLQGKIMSPGTGRKCHPPPKIVFLLPFLVRNSAKGQTLVLKCCLLKDFTPQKNSVHLYYHIFIILLLIFNFHLFFYFSDINRCFFRFFLNIWLRFC